MFWSGVEHLTTEYRHHCLDVSIPERGLDVLELPDIDTAILLFSSFNP